MEGTDISEASNPNTCSRALQEHEDVVDVLCRLLSRSCHVYLNHVPSVTGTCCSTVVHAVVRQQKAPHKRVLRLRELGH